MTSSIVLAKLREAMELVRNMSVRIWEGSADSAEIVESNGGYGRCTPITPVDYLWSPGGFIGELEREVVQAAIELISKAEIEGGGSLKDEIDEFWQAHYWTLQEVRPFGIRLTQLDDWKRSQDGTIPPRGTILLWIYSAPIVEDIEAREERMAVPGYYFDNSGKFVEPPRGGDCEVSYVLSTKVRHIINVGTVGLPRNFDQRACYCRLTFAGDSFTLTYRRLEYDVRGAVQANFASGVPSSISWQLLDKKPRSRRYR